MGPEESAGTSFRARYAVLFDALAVDLDRDPVA